MNLKVMGWLYDNKSLVMTGYNILGGFLICIAMGLIGCTVTEFKGTTGTGTKAEMKTVSQDVKQAITVSTDYIEVNSDIKTQNIEEVLGGLK